MIVSREKVFVDGAQCTAPPESLAWPTFACAQILVFSTSGVPSMKSKAFVHDTMLTVASIIPLLPDDDEDGVDSQVAYYLDTNLLLMNRMGLEGLNSERTCT